MSNRNYIFVFLFFMTGVIGYGQVEFTAQLNKNKIGLNERLRIDFTMNQNGDNFTPPDFEDFKVYAGPRQSISQSWVNGKRSFSKTYTYYLEPTKRGNFTIGQATVEINGETYKTSPLPVEVTASVDEPRDGEDEEIKEYASDIHLVTEVSNSSPYLNEGITVTYKLYVGQDANVSNWQGNDIPKYANFWSHDVQINPNKVYHGSYRGDDNYRYVYLKQVVLYPQKEGEIVIEPLTLNYTTEIPTSRRDIFGRQIYKPVDKKMSSGSRTIKVKPLPEEGKPADFSGAVGQFSYALESSKEELEAEESLDVNVKISGTGNLKLFQIPKLEAPSSFEVYDPEHIENVKIDGGGMQGSISNRYTIVPNAKGEFDLKTRPFSYFDPKAKAYKTLAPKQTKVRVTSGSRSLITQSGDSTSGSGGIQSGQRQVVSSDAHFEYIKLKTNIKDKKRAPFFNSPTFWALLLLPVILLPMVIGVGNKRIEKINDYTGKRIKRADKLAKKYLSEAKKAMGNQEAYYEALESALHNYLKAKLDIPTAEMTKERISELLQNRQVSKETGDRFIGLLASCEFARYTPPSDQGMQQDYDKAAEIIAAVDKQLKV